MANLGMRTTVISGYKIYVDTVPREGGMQKIIGLKLNLGWS